jgi:CheY-like chemotaxis protein
MRVLFVEDNITISMVSELMLNKVGAVLTMTENGQDALEKFQLDQFDLVITDAMMPVMDGNELSRQLRHKDYVGPIIAITAALFGEEMNALMESVVNKVLSKSLHINVLEQAVGLLRPIQA